MTNQVDSLLKSLKFDENNLIDAAVGQPALYMQAAEYWAQQAEKRMRLKLELETTRAAEEAKFREAMEQEGQRVTERLADNHLSNTSAIRGLQIKLAKAELAEAMSKSLMEACRMRRDSIRVIADLQNAAMTADGLARRIAAENTALRQRAQDKYPEQATSAGKSRVP